MYKIIYIILGIIFYNNLYAQTLSIDTICLRTKFEQSIIKIEQTNRDVEQFLEEFNTSQKRPILKKNNKLICYDIFIDSLYFEVIKTKLSFLQKKDSIKENGKFVTGAPFLYFRAKIRKNNLIVIVGYVGFRKHYNFDKYSLKLLECVQ